MFTALNHKSLGKWLCFLLILICGNNAFSQITTFNDSFNDGNITANPSWVNNTSAFTVSSVAPLEGSHSLRSNTGNVVSSIYVQYGTSTNLSTANYSWNLIYKATTNSNPDELAFGGAINTNNNHWRYWIGATSTNPATCFGLYVSHSAGNLKFARKRNNGTWDIATHPINLNQTYSIKINRRYDGYFEFMVDTGTAEASTARWQGYVTDVLNSGSSDIYMIMHANETSANRFQWDKLGIFTKSLSVTQLTKGVHDADLEEGMTNKAVIGFAVTSEGSITLEDLRISTSSNNNQGTFANVKLIKSVDDDFSTSNDNTTVNGITITLNGSNVLIENINSTLNSNTENYFFVLDVVNNNGGSPPSNMQFSMTCNNCGPANTNVVTTNSEKVNNFSFSSQLYQMVRVYTWKNTTVVGDYTDNWQNSSAWEPFRSSPSANDILAFSKGGTVNPLNIPTQSVKKIIIRNNTTVNITTSSLTNANATITIVGGASEDVNIESGSSLNVSSTANTFSLSMSANTTALIYGNINMSGAAHRLIAASENGIQFKASSYFTGSNNLSGNPFGNTIANSVVFENASTLEDQVGLDYFSNANVLSLSNESIYKHSSTTTASLTNKTFGILEVSSGATFAIGAGTINVNNNVVGLGNITSTSGILNLFGNFNNTGTFTPGTGTVNYLGENQNVKATSYYNLNFTNSGTKTLLGNVNFATGSAATLTLAENVVLNCSTYTVTASSASSSINVNGYLITSNTAGLSGSNSTTLRSTNSPTINLGANSTIEYNSTSTQAISARTDYKNIKATGAGTKNTAAITLSGDLNIANGVIFNMGTNALAGTFTTSGAGLFRTSNTGLTPVTSNITWNFDYEANGASQNIVAGNYSNLILSGSGTKTARGDINVSNELDIQSGKTFTMATFVLQNVGSTKGTGTLRIENTSASPIPANKTWTYTVQYNGAAQTLVGGTYANLSITGSGNKTLNADITIDQNLNINTSRTLDAQSFVINGITTTSGTGLLKTANTSLQPLPNNKTYTFTVEYYATIGNQYVVPGDYTSLTLSGARTTHSLFVANNDTIKISGTFTASATFAGGAYVMTGNTIKLDGAAQNIPAFAFNNLSIEGTGDKTAAANFAVNGNLNIANGRVLVMSTRQLTVLGTTSGTGTLRTTNTSSTPIPLNKTWSFTVEYNTTASQTVVVGNYTNLSVLGNRSANNVTFANGSTINIAGVFNPGASFTTGNYITTNNTIQFNGAAQNIPAFKFNNLSIEGSADKTLTGNIEVVNALNLVENNLLLDNFTATFNGSINYSNGKLNAGTCGAPKGNIIVRGTGDFNNLKLNENANYINNFTADRNGNINITEDINISGTLTLTQGVVVTNKILSFNSANIPIVKTNGQINLQSDATLRFGECDYAGNAFTLPNDLFVNTIFKNLTVGRTNGLTLGNQMLNITGTIKMLAGVLTTNSNITLISNADGTARVDSITCNGCNISGNVISQRFIPGGEGKRRWRLVSSPVNTGGSIALSQIIDDMHVTGVGGASKGFDESPNNAYSVKTYKESLTGNSNSGWVFPSSIDTNYNVGVGICLFVRGDRNTPDPFLNWATPNDATLDFTGSLTIGDVNLPVTYTNTNNTSDGWNLVANPYASTIDWNSVQGWQKNNILPKLWLFNPVYGSYGIYDPDLDEGTNGSTRYISSGQAFFVKATNVNTSISINERAKVSNAGTNFFKNNNNAKFNLLRITLERDSFTKDESILYLSENASGNFIDQSDASKMFNDNMNFYLKSDEGYNLSINQHPLPNGPDTIKASIFSYSGVDIWTGTYKLEFKGVENLYANIDVYLEDLYANKKINIREISTYVFELDNNSASMGNDRFRIILGKNNNPVGVEEITKSENIKVYPNPFDDSINIQISNLNKSEKIKYKIYNQMGQEVLENEISMQKNQSATINVASLNKGLYYLHIYSEKNNEVIKIIK